MDQIFEDLSKNGRDTVDGVIQWMKDEKIIDDKKLTEEAARAHFADVTGKIELTQFKEVMGILEGLTSIDIDKPQLDKAGKSGLDRLDETFAKLQKDGKNNVDGIIHWLQEAKLIDNNKESEDKARKLFNDVKDGEIIDLQKFREVLEKLAGEQQKTLADFTKILTKEAPKWLEAFGAAASAFKDTFNKK